MSKSRVHKLVIPYHQGGYDALEPQSKHSHTSYIRFEASLPNETWQADTTHWTLADRTDIEILDIIDNYSRYIIAAEAFQRTRATDAVFTQAFTTYGSLASILTDNGAIFTTQHGLGRDTLRHGVILCHIMIRKNTLENASSSTSLTSTSESSPQTENSSDSSISTQHAATKASTEKSNSLLMVRGVQDDPRLHNCGRGGT